MNLLLSHGVGSQFVRQAARAFEDAGVLAEFWTSIARGKESKVDSLLPSRVREEMRRRAYDDDILAKTNSQFSREALRLLASRSGHPNLIREQSPISVESVIRSVDRGVSRRLDRGGIDTVYAYEDGAVESFRMAKKKGIRCVYELPIGHWRLGVRIFHEELALQPEWASTLDGLHDSEAKLAGKDEEARLADLIIVPSQFVADSLAECPGVSAEIKVVNYGCPPAVSEVTIQESGPLQALFVGSLGARKGVPYVFEAVKRSKVDLTLIGPRPGASCPALESALPAHRYLGSIPRDRVLEEMRRHDVFVFPTLFEGLANVLLEALSSGLVPITTPNSGAAGIIEDGVNGFIVPMRSSAAVEEKLDLLSSDRKRLLSMKEAALSTAKVHSWDRYREQLVTAVGAQRK